jgi:hypothetical protein
MSEENLNEKVNIDGRTKLYKETVARIQMARKLREQRTKAMKENKFNGLYDDGSGKGAMIPEPVDFTFHEAMKTVEKYKQLREKKKTLMGAEKKESVENNDNALDEASDMMLRSWIRKNYPNADNKKFNQILAAMQKQYNKDPKGYTYGGGFTKVAKDAKINEESELRTDLHHPKGKAVVTKDGKLVKVYRTEKAARKHAMTGKPVNEDIEESIGGVEDAVKMKGEKFVMGEEELSPEQKKYRAFFQKAL